MATQVCQIAHAAHEAGIHLSRETERPSSIVVCGVPHERALYQALARIRDAGVKAVLFTEPDLGGCGTALATEPLPPERRHLFRRYKLWEAPA